MTRLLSAAFALLASTAALAQASTPEAPVEHAGPFAVIVFLLLFVGGIVAYLVYLWVGARKDKAAAAAAGSVEQRST